MNAFIDTFWRIALRRLGPEDLPDSQLLLSLIVVAYAVVHGSVVWIQFQTPGLVVQLVVLELLLLSAFVWALLLLAGLRGRYQRTMSALVGTSTLLGAISAPFVFWLNADLASQLQVLPQIAILGIVLWSFAIDGHILSRALERPFAIGVALAVCYLFLSFRVIGFLLPGR